MDNQINFDNKLVLIDGNSLINRAFYALPPLTDREGRPTNAVYGFVNIVIKIINEIAPKYMAVCFDVSYPTFRHLMYEGYKANRKRMPEELASQMPILKEVLGGMGIACVEKKGLEADDLIGCLAKGSDVPVAIITGDKDSLQLIDDKITVLLTKKGISETAEINMNNIVTEYGVSADRVVDLKSLMGDSSDNIPGVAGVGEKTAVKLISEYGSLDGVYNNIDKVAGKLKDKLTDGKESAYMSYELATIKCDGSLNLTKDDFGYTYPFAPSVREMFDRLNFRSLVKRELYAGGAEDGGAAVGSDAKAESAAVGSAAELERLVADASELALVLGESIHIALVTGIDYRIDIKMDLISDGISTDEALTVLKPALENDKITKIVHDGKAVKHYLDSYGIDIKNMWDVQLAQYVADSNVDNSNLIKLLGYHGLSFETPAASMVAVKSRLEEEVNHGLLYGLEMPLSKVLYDMEKVGFKLDLGVLNEMGEKFFAELTSISERIYELTGERFNLNSPKQLGEVLYDKLGLKSYVVTKTKARSTGAEALEALRGEHEAVDLILRYRMLSKLNSTYVEGLRKMADGAGVVHTVFRQALTVTGRLSSTEPNLQNIPVREAEGREIRKAFVARDGYTLITADYSQIELRLLAHFSGEPKLIESYNCNEDIHARTASEVFGVPLDEVTKAMRRDAKAVNFGIIYGISDFGLAKNLNIPVAVAKRYITKYFENYPRVKRYMEDNVRDAYKHGGIELLSGRVRKIPELKSSNRNIRMFGERAAMNMPLQGTAADLIKIAMINADNAIKLKAPDSRLILQVHDELIAEVRAGSEDLVTQILKEEMEGAMKLRVPLVVDVRQGKSWFGVE